MNNIKYPLGWGDPVCIRQALVNHISGINYEIAYPNIDCMGYTPHYGDEKLIEYTHSVIERQTGHKYKHIIMTNGATGGISIAMRSFNKSFHKVATNPGPFFPLYPLMCEAAKMEHVILMPNYKWDSDTIFLLDSPSSPLSLINRGVANLPIVNPPPIILDAVYCNKICAPNVNVINFADIMVGSYSKLLGLSGVRIGWMATNNDLIYERLKKLVDGEYAGLSKPSMDILIKVLSNINWDGFEKSAKNRLDCNRGEWARLEKYLGDIPVNPVGMFHYGAMDKAAKKLFAKAGVEWVFGSKCGDSDDFGRFNLAQDCNLVLQAVISVLRTDVPRNKT